MKLTFSALKYLRRRQYRGALFMRLKPENRTHGRVRSSVRGGFTAASLSLLAYAPVGMLAGVLGTVARGQEWLAGHRQHKYSSEKINAPFKSPSHNTHDARRNREFEPPNRVHERHCSHGERLEIVF